MKKQAEGKQKVQREGKGFKDWEAKKSDIIEKTKTSFFAAMGRPEDVQDSDKSGLEDDSYADRKEKAPVADRRETAEPRVVKKEEERPIERQEEAVIQKEEVTAKQENAVQKEEKEVTPRIPSAKKEATPKAAPAQKEEKVETSQVEASQVEKVQGVEGQDDSGHAGAGPIQDEAKTPEKSLSQSGSQGGAEQ